MMAGILASLALATVAPSHPSPAGTGQCGWVRGRFAVYNGASVQRIWVIGTRRLIAVRDDDETLPSSIRTYERAGPFTTYGDALFGDFRVCALEPSVPGRMQHVRILATRNLRFRGKPVP